MKFNLILLACSLLLLSTAIIFEINYLNYGSPVSYSRWKTITFYDFKGFKKPSETFYGNKEFAFIRTNREGHFINDTTIELISYFHPSRSYVFEQHMRNPGLLTHELYHFHITEYCTRLLRKEILDHNRPVSRSKLDELCKKYEAVERDMQIMYDDESYHSYVLKEQIRWEHYIDNALAQLNPYREPVLYLKNRQ